MTGREVLARILFCGEPDLNNVLLHIPLGVIITLTCCFVSGWLGLAFTYVFARYELKESKIIQDKAYPDLQGCLWGIAISAVILLFMR